MLSRISNCAEVLSFDFVPIVMPMTHENLCRAAAVLLLENLETCFVRFE